VHNSSVNIFKQQLASPDVHADCFSVRVINIWNKSLFDGVDFSSLLRLYVLSKCNI